jgi:hypothetical protein
MSIALMLAGGIIFLPRSVKQVSDH